MKHLGQLGQLGELEDFDLVIIGNGAIGSALALHFSEEHKESRVAILGPLPRPGCASLAAGAMLNVFADLEAGALDYPVARAKFEIAVEASKMWEKHLSLLNARLDRVAPVRIDYGTYVVQTACSDRLDDQSFAAMIAYSKEYSEPLREVDPASIEGIKPTHRSRTTRAILLEREGSVSSRHLHHAFDEAFSRSPNVTTIDAEVESIDANGKLKVVKTKAGASIRAKHVVIAAGTRTQDFVNQLGLEKRIPRLVLGIGCSLILKSPTEIPKKVFRTPNRGLACGLYVVPYADNYCYVGATNCISPSEIPLPRVQAVSYLLTAAMEQVNTDFANAEVHKTLVGNRPTTLDTYPLFGQTSVEGVWIASGTKRDGFHMSPRIAQELTKCIGSGTGAQPFDGIFKPERRLILELPKKAAIDRAAAQIISAGLSGFTTTREEEEVVRGRILDAYERCGLAEHDVGIPPELLDMYRDGHARLNIEHLLRS